MQRTTMMLLMCLLFATACFGRVGDGRLEVHWVDVEGGAATLLVTPAGESVLIDSGNPGERDAGRVVKMARALGVERVDHLVITHYHGDHYGGAVELAKHLPIGRMYDHGVAPAEGKPLPPEFVKLREGRCTPLKPGDMLPLKQSEGMPALRITCLAAAQKFIAPTAAHRANPEACAEAIKHGPDASDNANSIVLLIQFGRFDFFDGGDLTWNMETKLVCPVNLVGEVDVYQVTHHGLDISNNPVVLKSLRPTVAVMNNGDRKGNGSITSETLRNTSSLKATYQVHETLWPNPHVNVARDFIANHTPKDECEGHPIHMTVAADGESYTITVPSTGHAATYQSK